MKPGALAKLHFNDKTYHLVRDPVNLYEGIEYYAMGNYVFLVMAQKRVQDVLWLYIWANRAHGWLENYHLDLVRFAQ